ncbi:MAG TPA: NUDIX hydrolase [Saprospiraceae bacterium]|nr:NUDIX hydrolase [Saprospiraceae bacterium]
MAKTKTFKVRLVLQHKGNILMLKQTTENGGKYTLVGGTVEENEFPVEALIRETKEESGITISRSDVHLVHTLFKKKKGDNRIVLYFKVKNWEGKLSSKEPEKFEGVDWFPIDKLPPNVSPTVKFILQRYNDGYNFSEMTKEELKRV